MKDLFFKTLFFSSLFASVKFFNMEMQGVALLSFLVGVLFLSIGDAICE